MKKCKDVFWCQVIDSVHRTQVGFSRQFNSRAFVARSHPSIVCLCPLLIRFDLKTCSLMYETVWADASYMQAEKSIRNFKALLTHSSVF